MRIGTGEPVGDRDGPAAVVDAIDLALEADRRGAVPARHAAADLVRVGHAAESLHRHGRRRRHGEVRVQRDLERERRVARIRDSNSVERFAAVTAEARL
jgi:hypothetical protein